MGQMIFADQFDIVEESQCDDNKCCTYKKNQVALSSTLAFLLHGPTLSHSTTPHLPPGSEMSPSQRLSASSHSVVLSNMKRTKLSPRPLRDSGWHRVFLLKNGETTVSKVAKAM